MLSRSREAGLYIELKKGMISNQDKYGTTGAACADANGIIGIVNPNGSGARFIVSRET
jgi:hypothetical protein